jgi:hypothetical protein
VRRDNTFLGKGRVAAIHAADDSGTMTTAMSLDDRLKST